MAKKTARDTELSGREKIREKLLDVFKDVDKGFADQRERSDDILDYWDIYNLKPSDRQFYSGNSHIFVPLVRTAIKARRTRFANQIFPQSGRYVEVTTENDEIPHATMALLEYYVRKAKLRTQIVPAILACGDVEGQYSLYVSWGKTKQDIVRKVIKSVEVAGAEMPEFGDVETMEEDKVSDERPYVEILLDGDLLLNPPTYDSVEDCIDNGGSLSIVRRWSKTKIRQMIDDEEFTKEAGEQILEALQRADEPGRKDTRKELADAAGIRISQGARYAQGYETWVKLKVDGEMKLCRAYYGGNQIILGCKRNPYWCDKVPVISAPVDKAPGIFKGRSPTADVRDLQILANDMTNAGADTGFYSAMPIVMTDPDKNPRFSTMVLGLAAVWATNPNDTKFAQFPELWKHSFEIVSACEGKINQIMGVNPAMIPQDVGQKQKRNQAEIANAQQVDILTTAEAVTNLEEGILTPLLQRFAEYDHQFRDKELTVKVFGEMGLRAKMEDIPLLQINRRYEFRWFGVEAARNAAQLQQQIAGMNVLKGIPPQMYAGYRLNLSPLITQMVENMFGPRLAPLIFEDMKKQLTVDPETENQMLSMRFDVMVHPGDNDVEHIKAHMPLAADDPAGNVRLHLMQHQAQMQAKAQAAAAQQAGGKGLPGSPGQPGAAGTPPGAQPGEPRLKGPPGMINADRMSSAGAVTMPRKF